MVDIFFCAQNISQFPIGFPANLIGLQSFWGGWLDGWLFVSDFSRFYGGIRKEGGSTGGTKEVGLTFAVFYKYT